MKTTTCFLILFLTGLDLWAQTAPAIRQTPRRIRAGTNTVVALPAPNFPAPITPAPAIQPATPASDENTSATAASANSKPAEEMIPAGNINFQGVDVNQVLEVYAQLVGRTLLRAGLPSASIVLKTETPLTKTEAIQALQAVLALNGISVVNVGDKFVKVLPMDQANSAGAAFDTSNATNLPDLGTYVTHIVQLKYVKPSEMVPIIQPFAKLPNSILPIDSNQILVLRDNAENVKRMLEMIAQVDVGGGNSEIVSEVIPIRYALAEDIANALNSLGGSGSTVSIGAPTTTPSTISGVRPGGANGSQNNSFGGNTGTQSRTGFGTANGAPSGSGSTFQQRLQSIIQRASGGGQQDQIQVFGQTKIIADQRSNSLLVFATASDMVRIKDIVAKLDVLLAQVLIESVIMDVNYGKSWNFGVSAVQNPQTYSPSIPVVGGGAINNGQPFFNFLNNMSTSVTNAPTLIGTNLVQTVVNTIFSRGAGSGTNGSSFASSVPNGFSYFANIGPNWNVALQAAAADTTTTVLQRPRIQTSQAKAATFFVGSTVPYVTSTYSGGTVGGDSSSYSQLSVGVELDVTPFINPDGLVVMDINQEIDEISGSVQIEGVGDVPTTTKRTLSSEIAVKDKDTIILGGFVRSEKDKSRSGIPLLQDIPILGALFSTRSSNKNRDELIVLMRPTVLRTPEVAAAQAIKEEQRLPGIAHAEADDDAEAQKMIDAERKEEQKAAKSKNHPKGVFTTDQGQDIDTNGVEHGTNNVPQNLNDDEQPNPAAGLY